MKKILLVLILIGSLTMLSMAQSSDYNKGEVFGGYSATFDGDSSAMHGFNGAGVYNFHQYVGVKVEGGATFRNESTSFSVWERKLYNVAAGIQVKNNDPDKVFKPFGHVLVGYGKYSSKVKTNTTFEFDQKGASVTVGGGFDFKVNDKIDIRAVQIDVVRILSFDNWTNLRFSSGVVFKF